MAINYTSSLGLGKPVTGTESGTWGDDVNNAITSYLDIAVAGTLSFNGDGAVTLSQTFGTSSATNIGAATAQYMVLRFTGTTTTKVVTAPSVSKLYLIDNATGYGVTIKASGQPGYTVAANSRAWVFFNGTDYQYATTTETGVTPATSGGTGQSSYAVGDLLYADTTTTLDKLAAVAEGSVLRAKGVGTAPAWEQVDLTTDVTGVLPPANGGAIEPGYPGGGYGIVPYGGMAPSVAIGSTLTASTIYYIAFYIHSQISVNAIKIHVSTAQAGSTIRLGLYGLVNGFPTTKLADFGTVSSDTAGLKSIALSTTLNSGYYYVAVCSDTSSVVVRASSILPVIVSPITGILVDFLQMVTRRTETTTGNTLPTTAAASGYFAATTGSADTTADVPGVYFNTV